MNSCNTLLNALRTGIHDKSLAALYALDGTQDSLDKARDRACRVVQSLIDTFCPGYSAPAALFSGPGRTEIGGNHTDHQHGRVLCGSVDMDCPARGFPPPPPTRHWWAISSTISAVRTSWTLSPSPKSASTPKTHTSASPAA